jgi:hypothetical protein
MITTHNTLAELVRAIRPHDALEEAQIASTLSARFAAKLQSWTG